MKKNIYFALILCVISCKDDNSVTTTPKVAQENVVENVGAKSNQLEKRYKGSDDIVEEIYQELILNDKELTKLDAKIRDLNNSTEDIIRQYRNILSKSESYYAEARKKTESITDSLMRNKLDSVILNSAMTYDGRVIDVRNAISHAQNNMKNINDLYTAYKIQRTLPEIEKYQKSNPFDLTNLNKLVEKQNTLLSDVQKVKNN